MDLKFIQYNNKLISRAREFRKSRTEAEIIFWNKVLKDKEVTNYKFTQQKPLGDFIADFYCSKLLLVIEIDGGIHNELKNRDKERSEILLYKYGIKVVRYNNEDILDNIENIIRDFKNQMKLREKYLKLKGI
ncbi:MAG: endonuclease domain-containing protein [Candidatus Paceibacterota bacterium]